MLGNMTPPPRQDWWHDMVHLRVLRFVDVPPPIPRGMMMPGNVLSHGGMASRASWLLGG